jgi:hypothetical protein
MYHPGTTIVEANGPHDDDASPKWFLAYFSRLGERRSL